MVPAAAHVKAQRQLTVGTRRGRVLHLVAIAEVLDRRVRLENRHVGQVRDPRQVIGDLLAFGLQRGFVGDVLQTATAAAGHVLAWRDDAVGSGLEDLDQIRLGEPAPGLAHPHARAIARSGVRAEHHKPIRARNALSAERQVVNRHFEFVITFGSFHGRQTIGVAVAGTLPKMAGYPVPDRRCVHERGLAGNQLAVFTEGKAIPQERLQPLALEMGFSETVFVFPPAGHETARVRIFTPATEIPFAGHPVLGTAVALAIAGELDRVDTGDAGRHIPLEIADRTVSGAFGCMHQPIPTVAPLPDPEPLFARLRVTGSELPVEIYDNGLPHVYVALPDEPRWQPSHRTTVPSPTSPAPATCRSSESTALRGRARWKTRMFAPADGVPEDAATGSAAGPLACHLARHGRIAFGDEIVISQGAEIGRPSTLYATAHGEAENHTGRSRGNGRRRRVRRVPPRLTAATTSRNRLREPVARVRRASTSGLRHRRGPRPRPVPARVRPPRR